MEKIPVKRKEQATPWWIWLIPALILGLLLLAIFDAFDNSERAAAERIVPTAVIEDPQATSADRPQPGLAGDVTDTDQTGARTPTEPLTDLAFLLNAPDPEAFIGQQVRLENVRVLRVPGDVAFWVGPNADQQLLVILDETPTPNDPTTEGRYDINPGQVINIYGEARAFPGVEEAIQQWNVSDEAQLEQQRVYVHADQLDIISQ